MPDDSGLIKSFRAAHTMSAFTQGQLFQFNLNGTSTIIPSLVRCVKTMNASGVAAATNFTASIPSASTTKPMGPAGPPTTASSLQPNRPQEGSPELQLEAMQLASNFILKATSLSRPALVSHSETPVSIASSGAAWKADNATGFVRIIPPQTNVVGLNVAAAIVGNDAKDCKGKFASARNSELIDSEVCSGGCRRAKTLRDLLLQNTLFFLAKQVASLCFRF